MTERPTDNLRFFHIDENLKRIREKIEEAAAKSGRLGNEINLMAVTKTVESEFINYALKSGVRLIGENKVQEIIRKAPELNLQGAGIHLIGHLQTNKISKIVGRVNCIESVDSVRLASEISKKSLQINKKTNILLEINAGKEESKFGFLPEQAMEAAEEISQFEGISIKGLMTVAPINVKKAEIRTIFSNMHALFVDIDTKKMDNICMDILSMGMSGDYEEAILEGSNSVRLGSAIFGARIY